MKAPKNLPTIKIDFDRISFYSSKQFYYSQNSDYEPDTLVSEISKADKKDENLNREHDGTLSLTAQNNLLRAIEKFVFYTNRVNEKKKKLHKKGKRTLKFVTLTLSSAQNHTDTEIKKGPLNQFLTELREKYNMKHYVWKAEKQKNGNLHFHVIIDVYIRYDEIRKIWNRCQNKLGYVDGFKKRMELLGFDGYRAAAGDFDSNISFDTLQKRWKRLLESDFNDPPSTEIRNVLKINKARAYFAKYFSKSSKIDSGFGRIWFASRSLTKDISLRAHYQGTCHGFTDFLWNKFSSKFREYEYAHVFWVQFSEYEGSFELDILKVFRAKIEEFILDFW